MKKVLNALFGVRRRKRLLFLLPALVAPLLLAAVELGHAVARNVSLAGVVSALKAPLALFAERSPGGRQPGGLLTTKPDYGPNEAALDAGLDAGLERYPLSSMDSSDTTEEGLVQVYGNSSFKNGIGVGGTLGFFPGSSTSHLDRDTIPRAIADAFNWDLPLAFSAVHETRGSALIPPLDFPVVIAPSEDQPSTPSTSDLPGNESLPRILAVPEPSSWAVLLAGLLVIVVAVRRRIVRQIGLVDPQ